MKYRTIVADPPWRYTNDRGTQTRSRAGRSSTVAEGNYSTMSNAEIAALPVQNLADSDCALYLWVTNPRIFGHVNRLRDPVSPIDIVDGWGFTYITLLTWVKTGPPGLGFHFRGNTEHVIYAIRGDVRIPAELRETNVITAPRRAHSQKPEHFYDLVQRVSRPPFLEMFSREHRFFWDVWGNESANTATLEPAAMTKPVVTIRCPDCPHGTLVERFNTKNGSRFLGCDHHPTCKHSEPLPAYIEMVRMGAPQLPGFDGA